MVESTQITSTSTHEATSNPALAAGVLAPVALGLMQHEVSEWGDEQMPDENCGETLLRVEDSATTPASDTPGDAKPEAELHFTVDHAVGSPLVEPAVEAEYPHKKPTLLDLRTRKIREFLRSTGNAWVSSAEIGAALEEPDITPRTRRVAVCRVLKELEAEGIGVAHKGTHNSRLYKLASEVADEDGALLTPVFKPPHKKLTRWGLSQSGEEIFIKDRPLELDALALRCLRLLIENPLGMTRGMLLRTLQAQELHANTGTEYTEIDVLNALGELRDKVDNDNRSPRIYELHKTHSHGHFKLIMIAGRLVA